jgi:predicted nuclease of predicted toxin-antitoxin system
VQPIKLLLDENLSPAIGVRLRNDGVDVAHVRDRGLNGASDKDVMDRAYHEDRILVTANVGDFDKLARARELHAGIVLIEDGALRRDEQEQVVREAIAAIEAEFAAGHDMVNRVLRINLAGDKTFETVPPSQP